MEVNYVDQYIRRRNAAAGGEPPFDPQATVGIGKSGSSGRHQHHHMPMPMDSLQLQLATFEDKMLNLTKLVKLSQTLAEEKEADIRKENHDLKVRLRRQEQLNTKLANEMKELQMQFPQILRDGLQTTSGQLQQELSQLDRVVRDTTRYVDQKSAETKDELTTALLGHMESTLSSRIAGLKEESIDQLKAAAAEHCTALGAIQDRFELLEKQTLEQFRKQTDDKVAFVTNQMHEAIMNEVRVCVRAVNDDFLEQLDIMKQTIGKTEKRCGALEVALSEFTKRYHDNMVSLTGKHDDSTAAMKDLMTLQDQTRTVVGGELEKTKDWATRNLSRLKKHIDTLNADIHALKESHIDMTGSIDRLKHQHSDERERLTQLVNTKSKEAAMLTEMVDKEIVGIGAITREHQHRTGSPAPSSVPAKPGAPSTSGLSGMAFGSNKTEPPASLFDELAFTRQRQPSPGKAC